MTQTETAHVQTGLPTNPHYCPELIAFLKPWDTTTLEWDHVRTHGAHQRHKCLCGELVPHNQEGGTQGKTPLPTRTICSNHGRFCFGAVKRKKNVYSVRQAVVSQGEKKKDPTYLPLSQEEPWMKGPLKRKKSKYYNPPEVPTNQEQKNTCQGREHLKMRVLP